MFDLTYQASLDTVIERCDVFRQMVSTDIPIHLAGTKSDLVHRRVVIHEQAIAVAQILNILCIETSVDNTPNSVETSPECISNVKEVFMTLVTKTYQRLKINATEKYRH